MRIDQQWEWERKREEEKSLVALQRLLNSEATWQFISIILSSFSSSAMKQAFNGHYPIELRQSKASEANRNAATSFCEFPYPLILFSTISLQVKSEYN
jgi:hypothetical protein